MQQRHACIAIDPEVMTIRSAVPKTEVHGIGNCSELVRGQAMQWIGYETGDTAHSSSRRSANLICERRDFRYQNFRSRTRCAQNRNPRECSTDQSFGLDIARSPTAVQQFEDLPTVIPAVSRLGSCQPFPY